jgi:hypothetical protein
MAPIRHALAPALLLATLAVTPTLAQEEAVEPPGDFTQKMTDKVAEVIEAVPPIRRLPAAEGVAYEVVDSEAFLARLQDKLREDYPAEYIEAEENAFKRLGLLGPDQDLEKLTLKLYDQQALAAYEPETRTFSIIGPVKRIGPTEEIIVAHEYGHALQDQAFDLAGFYDEDLDAADRIWARAALVEGDATALMYDWAARKLKLSDLLSVSAQALSQQDANKLNRLPDILTRPLEFAYIDGYAFVNALRGQGDWDAVDAAFESPPASTEQILHPELYPGEEPVQVELPNVAAELGSDWTLSYEQTMGEMQTHVWLADGKKARSLFPALPAQLPNSEAAAGWGGDRLMSLDGPEGAWAVVWQTDWDSKVDQKEFRSTARKVMADLPGAHSATNADIAGGLSSPVLVLVADSDATLGTLEDALGI